MDCLTFWGRRGGGYEGLNLVLLSLFGYRFHPWCLDVHSGGQSGGGKSLSRLYHRNCKVQEVDTW